MPLARIITRSQACSRELALDLLARGYTVEIVSPDKVPDNIADLELRVDEGPGDQLLASVETHNGNRSASIDFVHHLKAPMGDFIRRPLNSSAPVPAMMKFDAEPGSAAKDLNVAAPPLAPQTVTAAAEVFIDPSSEPAEHGR